MSSAVEVTRADHVLTIVMNRPEAKNAVNLAVAEGVAAALDELERDDDLRVGVLTGAGGTFCAGMDLKSFLAGENPAIPGRGLAGLTEAPPKKPLIAAVEGWALAGGFEMLLACDMVVAADDARFGIPEVKRSLIAGAGAALLLARRIPRAVAMELLLTGDPFSANRAYELGLVNRVVEPGSALDVALEMAAVIAANGPLAVKVTKQISDESLGWSVHEQWEKQLAMMMPVFDSADAKEGATAFAEKREPVWTGR